MTWTQVGFRPAVKPGPRQRARETKTSKRHGGGIIAVEMSSVELMKAPGATKNLVETKPNSNDKEKERKYLARESSISVDTRRMLLILYSI